MIHDHKLNKAVPIPLYYQLKSIILSEIEDGHYQPNDLIPTEEELIHLFGVSRTTVRQAITELVKEGKLYRIKSKGTFVALHKINQNFISKLESFNDQILRQQKTPKTEVLSLQLMTPSRQIADALQIPYTEQVIFLHRKRFADDSPIVVVQTYLPYNRCSFLMKHDFSVESLYQILEDHNPEYRIHFVNRIIESVKATAQNAKYLLMKTGDPILLFSSVGYTVKDIPLEYSIAYYRGDCNKFEVTVMT